jgi:O-antigen/teichoic acid export membrane protein
MQESNRVIKNTGFLYAKMGITVFISLYTTRLILNTLGASDFGIFNIVGGAIAMLGFLNGAMASATQRFMSFSNGEGDNHKQLRIFNISFVLHIAIAFFMGIVLLIAGWFFFNGLLNIPSDRIFAAKVVYGSLIISTIFTVMTVPYDAVMNAHENMLYYAIVGVIESLLKLGVAFLIVNAMTDKLVLYGILMACIPLITMTIMRVYCHKNYLECYISPRKYWDRTLMLEMTGYASWNLIGAAVNIVSNYGQGIILNIFFGTVLNAAQGISAQINGQLETLATNMLKALNPILGKSAGAKNNSLLLKATLMGAKYSSILFLLVAIPFFIQAPFILKLWLKDIPEWTIVFVRFQLIKSFIAFQFSTIPKALAANGNIKGMTFFATISNVLQLPIIYVLFKLEFPPYNLYVVAIIFGAILPYFISVYYAKLLVDFSIRDYLKYVTLPVYFLLSFIFVEMMVFSYFIKINSVFLLLLFLGIFLFSFFLFFFYVTCAREERILFISLKNKIFKK